MEPLVLGSTLFLTCEQSIIYLVITILSLAARRITLLCYDHGISLFVKMPNLYVSGSVSPLPCTHKKILLRSIRPIELQTGSFCRSCALKHPSARRPWGPFRFITATHSPCIIYNTYHQVITLVRVVMQLTCSISLRIEKTLWNIEAYESFVYIYK